MSRRDLLSSGETSQFFAFLSFASTSYFQLFYQTLKVNEVTLGYINCLISSSPCKVNFINTDLKELNDKKKFAKITYIIKVKLIITL